MSPFAPLFRMAHAAPVTLASFGFAAILFAPALEAQLSVGDPEGASVPAHVDRTDDVPPEIAEAVRGAIAELWDFAVAPDEIVVAWEAPLPEPIGEHGEVRLVGTGAGGHWMIEVAGSGGVSRHRLRAGHVREIPVAARALQRGDHLLDGDIVAGSTISWGAPTEESPRSRGVMPAPGWEVRSRIEAGEELRSPKVAPPLAVRAGDVVAVRVRRGAVAVEVVGEVRSAGSISDQVTIRLPNGRTASGVVRSASVVELVER